MDSLADFLGVPDPAKPEAKSPSKEAPAGRLSVKDFCKSILNSSTYREHLLRAISVDELPPAVECLLWHYAYGKPIERVEVKDVTDPLEDFSAEQCEERAMQLLEISRRMRQEEERSAESGDDSPASRETLH